VVFPLLRTLTPPKKKRKDEGKGREGRKKKNKKKKEEGGKALYISSPVLTGQEGAEEEKGEGEEGGEGKKNFPSPPSSRCEKRKKTWEKRIRKRRGGKKKGEGTQPGVYAWT